MAKTEPINVANPAGGSDPKLGDDYIRALAAAVIEILNVDHYVGSPTNNAYDEDAAGEHSKISLNAPLAADPTAVANKGFLYTKDVGDVVELFWIDESGNVKQLTSGGIIKIAATDIANDLIDSQHYAAASIDNEHLADNAVDSDELAAGSVDVAHLSAGAKTAGFTPTAYAGEASVTFPNGSIFKHGYKVNTTDTLTITFADDAVAAFPGGVVSCNVVRKDADASAGISQSVFIKTLSTTQLIAFCGESGYHDGFYWQAWGW